MQQMAMQNQMAQIGRRKRKKRKRARPSTAKYGWGPGGMKALSTSMSGRPVSASTRKKRRKRRSSAKRRKTLQENA